MPYDSNNEIPEAVRNAIPSAEGQSIWRKGYNSGWEQYHDEGKAAAIGWTALKNAGYKKNAEGKWSKITQHEDVVTIEDIEIFRAGKWNGDEYTEQDLQDIVNNFLALQAELTPPVKLGHDKSQKLLQQDGYPSAGWISNLKKVGDKLIATFSNIPRRIAELIKNKAYRKISSEMWWNYKDEVGKIYNKVLWGVALLGEDIPVIGSLADIEALYSQGYLEDLHVVTFNTGGEKKMIEENPKLKEYEDEIAKLKAELGAKEEEVEEKAGELKTLSNNLDETNLKLVEIAEKQKSGEIKLYIKDMKLKGKILPKHETLVEAILSSEDTIKLYSADKKEVEKPVSEVFKEYLATLPKLVGFGELSQNVEPEGGSENGMDMHDKIVAFCKEHKEYNSDNPDHYLKVYQIIAKQEAQKVGGEK